MVDLELLPPPCALPPERCCRGLLLLRLTTPPLHSATTAAAAAACPAGSEASSLQQHTVSLVINLSHVGNVKSRGYLLSAGIRRAVGIQLCFLILFECCCFFGELLCCQGKSEQVSSQITLATLAWLHCSCSLLFCCSQVVNTYHADNENTSI